MNFGIPERENPSPVIREVKEIKRKKQDPDDDELTIEPFDDLEIYNIVKDIFDPEYPYTLAQLGVMQPKFCEVRNNREVIVKFKPTVSQCSMATLIGLCIHVKLRRSIPRRMKLRVYLIPGSHESEKDVNKQLNDKERVFAALENDNLLRVVNNCLRVVK